MTSYSTLATAAALLVLSSPTGRTAETLEPYTAGVIQPIHADSIQSTTGGAAASPNQKLKSQNAEALAAAKPWRTRGQELLGQKKYREAIDAFSTAITAYPGYVAAYNDRGIAHHRLHELDAALADYAEALRLNPDDRVCHYNRALVEKERGDTTRYLEDLRISARLGFAKAAEALRAWDSAHAKENDEARQREGKHAEPLPDPQTTPAAQTWGTTWIMQGDWGTFQLEQKGTKVSGHIIGGWAEGDISGSVSGNVCNAVFTRTGRTHVDGQLQLTLAPDGHSLTGNWKFNESGVWAASKLSGERSAKPFVPAKPGPVAKSAVVGTWYGVAKTVGTLELKPDGTYVYGGNPGGSYSITEKGIDFQGPLAAWGGGHATLKGGTLEFYWTSSAGTNWFTFAK